VVEDADVGRRWDTKLAWEVDGRDPVRRGWGGGGFFGGGGGGGGPARRGPRGGGDGGGEGQRFYGVRHAEHS